MMTCTAKELCAATGGTLVQDGEGFSCVSTDSRRVEGVTSSRRGRPPPS